MCALALATFTQGLPPVGGDAADMLAPGHLEEDTDVSILLGLDNNEADLVDMLLPFWKSSFAAGAGAGTTAVACTAADSAADSAELLHSMTGTFSRGGFLDVLCDSETHQTANPAASAAATAATTSADEIMFRVSLASSNATAAAAAADADAPKLHGSRAAAHSSTHAAAAAAAALPAWTPAAAAHASYFPASSPIAATPGSPQGPLAAGWKSEGVSSDGLLRTESSTESAITAHTKPLLLAAQCVSSHRRTTRPTTNATRVSGVSHGKRCSEVSAAALSGTPAPKMSRLGVAAAHLPPASAVSPMPATYFSAVARFDLPQVKYQQLGADDVETDDNQQPGAPVAYFVYGQIEDANFTQQLQRTTDSLKLAGAMQNASGSKLGAIQAIPSQCHPGMGSVSGGSWLLDLSLLPGENFGVSDLKLFEQQFATSNPLNPMHDGLSHMQATAPLYHSLSVPVHHPALGHMQATAPLYHSSSVPVPNCPWATIGYQATEFLEHEETFFEFAGDGCAVDDFDLNLWDCLDSLDSCEGSHVGNFDLGQDSCTFDLGL